MTNPLLNNTSPRRAQNLKEIVSLCKRRGIIFPGSEVYGGFANTYSFGPYGAQLKKNLRDAWWNRFVISREDIVGCDGPILLHPGVWKASGHVEGFSDALVDCRACKGRLRADHLVEEALNIDVEGLAPDEIDELINSKGVKCPKCGVCDFTPTRHFNLMFKTNRGLVEGDADIAYLRPETAQAIFVDFKNICDACRMRLPFGVAQIGKAFRNEITPKNFIFRTIEFEQMEIEYFIKESMWEENFEDWLVEMEEWCSEIGLDSALLHRKEHAKEKLSHYSKRTVDIEFDFPFGRSELYGLAYRSDFDLRAHEAGSKKSLSMTDSQTQQRLLPHVIEPTFGLDRTVLALLFSAYRTETLDNGSERVVLGFKPHIAPVQCGIFPLMSKPELTAKAREVFKSLQGALRVEFDQSGAIGKRYRRHDEIGTPYCITIDYETLEDESVTLRCRDTMKQERIPLSKLKEILLGRILA